jgi:UDP-N-acetylglucosamine 2-epimerase (non-hydrolysing)
MLDLLCRTRLVTTDSGGLQEEASYLGVPVVVLRRSTPRWEGVAAGTAVLVGLDAGLAVQTARRLATSEEQERVAAVPCPYGDGRTSERVVELLSDPDTARLLRLREPDFVGKCAPA